MQVGIGFTYPGQGLQFQAEQVRVADIAVAAAVADHRVVFLGLELGAALEVAELVGAEVRGAVHHRTRRERRGNPGDGAGQ